MFFIYKIIFNRLLLSNIEIKVLISMNGISEVLSYQLLNKIPTAYYLTTKPFKNKIGLSEKALILRTTQQK